MRLTTLANGLRVASRAMPGYATAAVGLYVESGSRSEPAALNGIAHLFEHMVFKGAGGRSARAISEAIEDVGGELNACTEREGTNFTASVMPEHVPLAVELIADLVLRAHLSPDELAREKDVVLQELGEARDTPNDIIFDELWSAAFDAQPIGRSILGDEASIERIGTGDLEAWRSGQFRGGNVILVGAGKVEHEALVALAETQFAAVEPGQPAKPEPAHFTGGSRIGRTPSEQAHLTIGLAAPSNRAPDYLAARLFTDLVGGGMSSRLFQELREERGLAYSIYSVLHPFADTGLFYAYAATAKRQSADAAQLIEDIIRAAAADASQRELDRARIQARAALLMSLETPWGQAAYVARQLSIHGRLVEPAEVLEKLAAVTLDDVRAAGAAMVAGPRARATIGVPAVRAA
ncbi:pitrilysin family protein [Sphingomonas sp.]|uniref:M16 family metallopeptidase n=1 Tax=Sphingomonas sp. TaxID=28214 RepID=UPI00286C0C0C|nr:pitrilysin family protein [Sphingomonas sp.]